MIYRLLLALSTSLLLYSCEKKIDFDLDQLPPKLVVEATIENNEAPMVILSQSLNYFATVDIQQLLNSFVHNADVYISNGTQTQKLIEYAVPIGGGYNLYYYSTDTINTANAFKGQLKRQYSLRIVTSGNEYTATTSIPDFNKGFDSIWWKSAPKGVEDNKAVVMIKVTDPPGYGDYVRYYTKRNSEPYFPGLNSVFDDLIIDGTTYELQVEPGMDRNAERDDSTHYFNHGDTVTVKLSSIDKATYDFWRTMEYTYASVGNPFSSPIKVLSNISNGALGYFGGYASQYRTIIIPK